MAKESESEVSHDVTDLARRVVEAQERRRLVEDELETLKSLRSVRVGIALSESASAGDLWRLPRRVMAALQRTPSPKAPDEPSVDNLLTAVAAEEDGFGLRRRRRPPYAHLRVLSFGAPDGLTRLATPAAAGDDRVDLVLVTADALEAPHFDAPVVALVRSLGDISAGEGADLIVTENAVVAAAAEERFGSDRILLVDPSIDPAEHNPVGFRRDPPYGVCLFADTEAEDERLAQLVGDLTGVALFTEIGSPTKHPEQREVAVEDWAALAKDYSAAVVDRRLHRSETAFIEHVLSLGASGTPIIAEPSRRLDALLPSYIPLKDWIGDGGAATSDLLSRERTSVALRRGVLGNHTRLRRFETILERLAIPLRSEPVVSILFATKRPDNLEAAYRNFAAQQYPHLELVTVLHGDGFDRAVVDRLNAEVGMSVHTIEAPERWTLGDCLNAAVDAANGELVTKMDDDDTYGRHHIGDLVTAYEFSGADIVGRAPDFVYLQASDQTLLVDTGLAERYGRHVAGPTMLLSRQLARTLRFERRSSAVDQSLYDRALAAGCLIYATSPFEFLLFRGSGDHTWVANDEDFIAASIQRWDGFRPEVIATQTDPR